MNKNNKNLLLYRIMPVTVFLVLVSLGFALSQSQPINQDVIVLNLTKDNCKDCHSLDKDRHHVFTIYNCSECHSKVLQVNGSHHYEVLVVENCMQCHNKDNVLILLMDKGNHGN